MNQEDIIRMARIAGVRDDDQRFEFSEYKYLERFAALVADSESKRIYNEGMVTVGHMRQQIAAEREACALKCEIMGIEGYGTLAIAASIRTRSQP